MKITLEDFILNDNNFDKIKKIIVEHKQFLEKIAVPLKTLGDANPEIFRRPASLRVKTIPSIVRKLNTDKVVPENIFAGIRNLDDIAGIRITIATQDQYEKIGTLLKSALGNLGDVELKKDWGSKNQPNEKGYAGDHYIIYEKTNYDIKCEIQVRTLTQDLWAVFTHYESYKSNEEIEESRAEEILNYSRLMNVSDYYAKLIRERKIHDADKFHKTKSPDANNISSSKFG